MLNAKKKQLRTKSYCRDGKIKVRCYSWEIFSKSRKKEELMSITYTLIYAQVNISSIGETQYSSGNTQQKGYNQ